MAKVIITIEDTAPDADGVATYEAGFEFIPPLTDLAGKSGAEVYAGLTMAQRTAFACRVVLDETSLITTTEVV